MRDLEDLLTFVGRQSDQKHLVLCTLVRKHGSSYRDVGAKKIVSFDGANSSETCGTLSGGCMEGAIERAAREGIERMPFLESFNTMSDEDRLMGYQTGCQGRIEVLFERIERGASLETVSDLIAYGSNKRARFGRFVRISLDAATLAERTFVDGIDSNQIDSNQKDPNQTNQTALFDPWIEPLSLTVIGCGADSDSYVEIARALGWRLRFVDYRSDLVARMRSSGAHAECLPTAEMAAAIPAGERSAVILATHNYEADLEILCGLSIIKVGYLGCLGPKARWERLKRDLNEFHEISLAREWEGRVFAPAGIFSRGRSPSEIALSIVAQIQGVMNESQTNHQWAVVLAAGEGRRFGESSKALANWKNTSLLSHAVATARGICGERVVVVTGAHKLVVETALNEMSASIARVHNDQWQAGLSSSIACGIRAVLERDPSAALTLLVPVDQPLITTEHLRRLCETAQFSDRCTLTSDDDRSGPPAALPRRLFTTALGLSGDHGLKSSLRPADLISIHAPLELRDADRPEELQALAREF